MTKFLRTLYSYIPQQFQRGYTEYQSTRRFLQQSQFLTTEQWQKYQFHRVQQLLNYCWQHIPAYRNLWENHNFTPEQFHSLADMAKIPMVNKEMIREQISLFSQRHKSACLYQTTGGSSGIPFGFYSTKTEEYREKAFIHDLWSKRHTPIDYHPLSLILRGKKLSSIKETDPLNGQYLSSYDIHEQHLATYLTIINHCSHPLLQAYPSSLSLLCQLFKKHNLIPKHQFKLILLGSEPLLPAQREVIDEVFHTPIQHWYGMSEKTALASWCEKSEQFHLYPQYGYTEILKPNGTPAQIGEEGEIVATSFLAEATPFIRYQTGDLAIKGENGCSLCGRNFPLLQSITGRTHEFIVGSDGTKIPMTAINMHDDTFDGISQFRFVQRKRGELEFQYIPDCQHPDIQRVQTRLQEKLGSIFTLRCQSVTSISKTTRGKHTFLEQKLEEL